MTASGTMMQIITGMIKILKFKIKSCFYRWTDDVGSVAIPTQFYSIAIRCRNMSVKISNCPVEDIQALGIVVYHEESSEVCIK